MGLSIFPLVYMTMSFQIIQITGVMKLLWPTCLQNFLKAFSLINFEDDFLQNKLDKGYYSSINTYYTLFGYKNDIYLYNVLDVLFFMGIFLVMIPVFALIKKIVPA